MESLVRLVDKINTQVFCLNPSHKGNHMDRVVYVDPTFIASCPNCGSDKFLYRKNNAITKKGHFITFEPDGFNWEGNEAKHYGIVRIDCTEEQARLWCGGIRNEQAESEALDYRNQAAARRQTIIDALKVSIPVPKPKAEVDESKKQIQDSLKIDTQYLALTGSGRQAENRAMIDGRPRKRRLDFEKALTVAQLKNWTKQTEDSKVVTLTNTTNIKEAL